MRHALDLYSLSGRVTRAQYLVSGAALALVKYLVDLAVALRFGVPWSPLVYVSPHLYPTALGEASRAFFVVLFAVSLPFVLAGVSLTARRLRDAGVHPFWSGLFFLPFLRYPAFVLFAVLPARKDAAQAAEPDAGYRAPAPAPDGADRDAQGDARPFGRIIPRDEAPALFFGIVVSLLCGVVAYLTMKLASGLLGGGLFVGAPFGLGFLPAYCTARAGTGSNLRAIGYGLLNLVLGLMLAMALGWEGAACMVMAFPLTAAVTIGGALVGRRVATARLQRVGLAALLVTPLGVGLDVATPPPAEELSVVSTVDVAAPPDEVWRRVVSFPPITAPPDAVFALVAMPLEARIDGEGPGALRRCVFTNGVFEEPIEVWKPGRELAFGVRSQPPGLSRYVSVRRGQFLLDDDGHGGTLLRGTTWYSLRVGPTKYWSRWTQRLMHAIHLRVLDHIQALAEGRYVPPTANNNTNDNAPLLPPWMAAAQATCGCTRPVAAQ